MTKAAFWTKAQSLVLFCQALDTMFADAFLTYAQPRTPQAMDV